MKHNTWQLLESAVLETLEDRQMMSASPSAGISLSNGTLSLTGDGTQPTQMVVDYAADHSLVYARIGSTQQYFPTAQVKTVNASLGNGNDYLYINPHLDVNAVITAGNGSDSIHAGGGNATITTGNGNTVLYTAQGNNTIHMGDGDNRVLGAGGNDSIVVGNGNDWVYGGAGNDNITSGTGDSTLFGASGDDVLVAGNGNNFINGGGGNDKISAGTGQDTLMGYSGNDNISGGGAESILMGGFGINTVNAAPTGAGTGTGTGGTTTTGNPSVGGSSGGSTGSTGTGSTSGSTGTGSGTGSTTTGSGSSSSTGSSGTGSSGSTGSTSKGSTGGTTTTPVVSTGGSSGSTTGVGTVVNTPPANSNAKAPTPIIKMLDGVRQTGLVVNVDALTSQLGSGTAITAVYAWDFGDPNTAYNTITGFNAAHVYDKAGTYTVKLTVTNQDGGVASVSQQVTIAASTRKQVFVDSVNGSDSNSGSQGAPYKTLAQAFNGLSDNTEILLHTGESFDVTGTLHISNKNVLVGSYGTGAQPVLNRIKGNGTSTIATFSGADGVTFQGITFDSPYGVGVNDQAPKNGVSGIYIGGSNVTVRNCTFKNVDDAINENGYPTGVLVQNNTAPLVTGVRGYFVWGQGWQGTIVGNTVANSTREHNVRLVDMDEVNIQDNNLSNLNRQDVDSADYSKGSIEMHRGEYAYIVGNTTHGGDIRTGPLGLHGEAVTSATEWCVIEDNDLTGTEISINAGSHHIMVDNNVIHNDVTEAISLGGVDAQGRTSQDITLENNTAIDNGSSGNFLRLNGYVNGIVMKNNVFAAPQIAKVGNTASAVVIAGSDLSSFTSISGNVWPDRGDVMAFTGGTESNSDWEGESKVHGDVFQDVNLKDTYQISLGSLTAGSDLLAA